MKKPEESKAKKEKEKIIPIMVKHILKKLGENKVKQKLVNVLLKKPEKNKVKH